MAFDYKKEYKEFYMPKNKPTIVNVPKMNYIAVRGNENIPSVLQNLSLSLFIFVHFPDLLIYSSITTAEKIMLFFCQPIFFKDSNSILKPKNLLKKQKSPILSDFLLIYSYIQSGGGEGSRTPVQKALTPVFYERSQYFKIPPSQRLLADSAFR